MYRGLTVQPQQHNLALGGLKHNHKSTHGTIMEKNAYKMQQYVLYTPHIHSHSHHQKADGAIKA